MLKNERIVDSPVAVGRSNLPDGSAVVSVSPALVGTLSVDARHGAILAADSTLAPELAKRTSRTVRCWSVVA